MTHSSDLRYDVYHIDQMPARVRADWESLCASHPSYTSPLLSPSFAGIVASVDPRSRVAAVYRGEELEMLLPFQKAGNGHARPLGAPFCDNSGPLFRSGADLDLRAVLAEIGLASFATTSMVDPYSHVDTIETETEGSHIIDLTGHSPDDFLEARREAHPKRFKNFRRLLRRLEEDHGEINLTYGPCETAEYLDMLDLKSRQFERSGYLDLTKAREARAILDAVQASEYGFAISLWAGPVMVARHFGFRHNRVFHPWIAVYNPDLADYSPGIQFMSLAIRAMPMMQLDVYDLAGGHDHYKKYISNRHVAHKTLRATSDSFLGQVHGLAHKAINRIGRSQPRSAIARLTRRLDHADACDSRLHKRASDFFFALRKRASN